MGKRRREINNPRGRTLLKPPGPTLKAHDCGQSYLCATAATGPRQSACPRWTTAVVYDEDRKGRRRKTQWYLLSRRCAAKSIWNQRLSEAGGPHAYLPSVARLELRSRKSGSGHEPQQSFGSLSGLGEMPRRQRALTYVRLLTTWVSASEAGVTCILHGRAAGALSAGRPARAK